MNPEGHTAIPFTISPTNHFLIEGTINEVFTRFILDSGAGRCCIGAAKASELGLMVTQSDQIASGVGEGYMNRFEVLVPQMTIGNHQMTDLKLVALDLSYVNQALESIGEVEVYGIIGGDLLLQYGVILDCERLQMDFEGIGTFNRMRSNHFVVEVALSGMDEKVRFIIDTGAGQTCMDMQKVQELGWELTEMEEQATGIGGTNMPLSTAIIPKMGFGDFQVFEYETTIIDLTHVNEALTEMGAKPVDGILGADILWDYKGIIDCKKKLMYLNL